MSGRKERKGRKEREKEDLRMTSTEWLCSDKEIRANERPARESEILTLCSKRKVKGKPREPLPEQARKYLQFSAYLFFVGIFYK